MAFYKSKTIGAGNNAKTIKGDGDSGYVTAILYLKPFESIFNGKRFNACANAKLAGCQNACLYKAGRGAMSNVQKGRTNKTQWFATDRKGFMETLATDIARFIRKADKEGLTPCIRLNGTSDIRWELIPVEYNGETFSNIFEAFEGIQFYDYTKLANRKNIPSNYNLTFSYSEANPAYAKQVKIALESGLNIAVVWRNIKAIPERFLGRNVVDGDKDDLRFLDPKNSVVALYAKGPAKKDTTGFVID
tara:strand:+ start:3063 stop:3803 length:741 start_codon:yes stop_codon:yes gene_type:complete